jgi:plasmid stabilization system protein ParE
VKRSDVEFHPAARLEVERTHAWYWERNEAAADAFLLEVEAALDEIAEAPNRWPRHLHGTRRLVLRRFPFSIVYMVRGSVPRIVAIAHAKRLPGYWRRRMPRT